MNGDFSRLTFTPQRRYSSVRLQQGRVFVDADWNEEHDILAHRIETETVDVIGGCGAPLHAPGFHVVASVAELTPEEKALAGNANPPAGPLLISAGRYYVGGMLVENPRIVSITEQPDFLPSGTAPLVTTADGAKLAFPPPPGTYLVYLDAWQRHVTALQDDSLREKALGGPDTATRTRSTWQVKLLEVPAGTACSSEPPAWLALTAPPSGTMTARTVAPTTPDNPCSIASGGGYRRLENQLYRVEIQESGELGSASFKWSRDNASVVTRWLGDGASADQLAVATLGPDEVLRFAPQQWVELIDDEREMAGQPGVLVQLANAENGVLTILPMTASGPLGFALFKSHPRVRRWEADAGGQALRTVEIPATNDGYVALEDGVEIRFSAGSYRSGDYWLIPARTATADIEWPAGEALVPHGVRHRYCRLGIATVNENGTQVSDCRLIFPPLTELPSGGDLRDHNRFLHGWDVVCGLQVHCGGAERQQVSVAPGYAIACDGSDIRIDAPQLVDLVEKAKAAKLLDDNGNGTACIRLLPAAGGGFALDVIADPEAQTSFWKKVLAGTLLQDVIDDCIRPLLDDLGKLMRRDTPTAALPLSDEHRNMTAALNLLVQLANRTRGAHVFLSANEHERLAKLYERLTKLLKSPTFCGIADGLRPLPDYPFGDSGLSTFYGKAAHRAMRVDAARNRIVSFGGDSTLLQAFDQESGELVLQLALPGDNLTVRDVLPLDRTLLVAATDATRTVFFSVDAEGFKLAGQQEVGGMAVMRMIGTSADPASSAFAIVRGIGLVPFTPSQPASIAGQKAVIEFKATGHLSTPVATQGGFINLLAGAATADASQQRYDSLVRIVIAQGTAREAGERTTLLTASGAPASGQDAIEIFNADLCYAVVDNGTQKSLLQLAGSRVLRTIDLGQPGAVALAAAPEIGTTLISFENEYLLSWINPDAERLDPADRLPLQIGPSAAMLARDAAGRTPRIAALNSASATLTLAPLEYAANKRRFDMAALADYRSRMLNAYADLLLRLAQRVKDCICDHLLVDCPSCDENDVIVLACVEVRAGRVYSICNFERREVVTFPKFFYWLSALPLVPLLREAIELACCKTLPDLLGDGLKSSGDLASSQQANRATIALRTLDVAALKQAASSYFGSLGNLGLESLSKTADAAAPQLSRGAAESVIQLSASGASQSLAARGVEVASVQAASEALLGTDAPRLGDVPIALAPGDRINLFTENGKVVFYTRAERLPAVVQKQAAARGSSASIREEAMQKVMDEHAREISALKSELAQLRAAVTTAQSPAKKRVAPSKR